MPGRNTEGFGNTCETGRRGEDRAALWLQSKGYKILQRNFRNRTGEVDIVARDGVNLCFIEVKHWNADALNDIAIAFGPAKRERMHRTAERWLALHADDLDPGYIPRLDLLVVERGSNEVRLYAGELDF